MPHISFVNPLRSRIFLFGRLQQGTILKKLFFLAQTGRLLSRERLKSQFLYEMNEIWVRQSDSKNILWTCYRSMRQHLSVPRCLRTRSSRLPLRRYGRIRFSRYVCAGGYTWLCPGRSAFHEGGKIHLYGHIDGSVF